MKEYKIVCDLKVENVRTGKTSYYECVSPIISGHSRALNIYKNKSQASECLKSVIEKCKAFDKSTRDRLDQYPNGSYELVYTQTNIRIMSRTVTEWQ